MQPSNHIDNKKTIDIDDNSTENVPLTEVDTANNPVVDVTTPQEQLRRLTAKEVEYLKGLASGLTRRDSIRQAYDVKPDVSVKTLDRMADNIQKRKTVLAVLERNNEIAQETITEVMAVSRQYASGGGKDGASYARVAVDGANSILDRLHGKAKQSIDITSQSVSLNIDLSVDE